MVIIQRNKLDIAYTQDFVVPDIADGWFLNLASNLPWQQKEISIMGKKVLQPRLICWYGEVSYTYSGSTLLPREWHPLLFEIKQQIEDNTQLKFNSCLLNYYRDGNDSMGFHADNEKQLRKNPSIASMSLGGKRRFVLKHKTDKTVPKVEIELGHGSLLVMKSQTQHYWLHGIPKTKKKVNPRINLTFRWTYPK